MKTLKSFAEIVKMAESSEVYVRWSRGPAMDKRRGYSLDYTNYRAHNGLSAQRVNPTDYSASTVAMMLVEYIFLKGKDARIFGWLCTAESNGTDSDGAPTIDAESIVPVGRWAGWPMGWLRHWPATTTITGWPCASRPRTRHPICRTTWASTANDEITNQLPGERSHPAAAGNAGPALGHNAV